LSPILLHYGDDAPYIPVNLDGKLLPFLLDTGASVSVLPKGKLLPLLPKPLCSYVCSDTRDSRMITAFGGHTVTVEGPYVFPIEILTHKMMHKFYVIDAPSPFIAGYDLVVAAHLIIDAAGRIVYTRNPASNSFVSASLEPISLPATDVAVISSSDLGDEPLPPPPPSVPATLEPSTPASALAAHEPSDALRHPVVAPLTPRSDDPSPSSTSVPSGEPPSDLDASDADVSEHLRVLYLSTLDEANLSPCLASNFRDLLVTHQHVFARSSTDIGFCDLLQHDIDTGDSAPIRQPPRRPPLASGTAEDDLIAEMLAADVIEPSDSPWASPVCLAKKPDGSYRFCVDYRRVNAVSRKNAYPIPDIQDAFDSLRGATHFATIDLLSGYWPKNVQHSAPGGAFIILNACPSGYQMPLLPFVA